MYSQLATVHFSTSLQFPCLNVYLIILVHPLEQLAVASRALPALRPRFLNLGAIGLSMSELGDLKSLSMRLESGTAAENGAELDDAL